MSTVASHYETHLAPIYLWMAGGMEHALNLGASDVAELVGRPGFAIDLGAGFGMHTIPLARSGFRVLAIDSSEILLDELRRQCVGLQVDAVHGDLLSFVEHASDKADLVLCMGDTLTHLQHEDDVHALMHAVSGALRPGGQLMATFRDYRTLPTGVHRFIPVRSDAERILTCFLEEAGDHVVVHDVLHEWNGSAWTMRTSSYQKLRLSPDAVIEAAKTAGLKCRVEPGPRGMLRVRAHA